MCRCVSVFGSAWMKVSKGVERSACISINKSVFVDTSKLYPSAPLSAGSARQQVLRVQLVESLRQEHAVLADQLAVKPDLAAAVLRPLDADHVPVDLRLVAVPAVLVGLPGSEVEGARDLLVEQDVAHRLQD